MPYLGIYEQKYFIWVFLVDNFKNTIVVFEISILKIVYFQNLTKQQKCLNLGPKTLDLGIFGLEFENNIVVIEINTLRFVSLQNLALKIKYLNLGSKMPYLGSFDQKCLSSVFLGENLKNTRVIFETSPLKYI